MGAAAPKTRSITSTKNYRLFKVDKENRPLVLPKHRKLKASMKQYGFLRSFPIVCVKNAAGELIVKDGQHRLAFAEELGLVVHYVVEDIDFDIAVVNSTATVWRPSDFAQMHAANGHEAYLDGLNFAERHKIPVGTAFALLAGTTTFKNIEASFQSGSFKIRDRDWADTVASTYSAIGRLSPAVKKKTFLDALMAACRVDGFSPDRLIAGAEKCREKLVSYGTREANLALLEELYNFGRKQLVPLKINAVQAMRDRSPYGMNESRKTKKQSAVA